jgi:hypothetical protein
MPTCSRFPARHRHACALGPVLAGFCWMGGMLVSAQARALALEDIGFAAYFTIGVEGTPQERIQRNTHQELADYICKGQIESINLQRTRRGDPPYAIEYIGYFFDPELGPNNFGLLQRQLICQTRDGISHINRPYSTAPVYTICRDQSQGSWLPFCKPVATCPVAPLTPVTDPEAIEHERGIYSTRPDISKLSARAAEGAQCILQRVKSLGKRAKFSSAYRPPTYQTHLREVWDKWKLLENNTEAACAALREIVAAEMDRHSIVHQPGKTSRHSLGNAVDIGSVPESEADAVAASCNMKRAVPGDAPHFEPR